MKMLNVKNDYPLFEKHPDLIKTATGKTINEITIDAVLTGKVTADDCRISAKTLEYHAQIEESAGNKPMAETLRRSAEMTRIPDHRIMEIYNALRPRASSKEDLEAIAEELEQQYNAPVNSAFIKEAVSVYEKRKMFR